MFNILLRVPICAIAIGIFSVSSATLLSNGSFEQALVPGWSNWGSDFTYMNVYNNTGSNGFSPPGSYGNFTGVVAQDGDQFVAGLGSTSQSGFISQLLSTPLTAGQRYSVSGYLHQAIRSDLDHPGTFAVYLSSGISDFSTNFKVGSFAPTVSSTEGWVYRVFEFDAPVNASAMPAIHFVSELAPNWNNSYVGLDNVKLESVPEPASMALLAIAGGAVLRKRKRNR